MRSSAVDILALDPERERERKLTSLDTESAKELGYNGKVSSYVQRDVAI